MKNRGNTGLGISKLEWEKVLESLSLNAFNELIAFNNGIVLKLGYQDNKVYILRDSKYEFSEGAELGKTIYQSIQEINKKLEGDPRTRFVEKVTENGEITSLVALIIAIKVLGDGEEQWDPIEKYLSIYNDFFNSINKKEVVIPDELKKSITWIKNTMEVKKWKLKELNNDFQISISNPIDSPNIKIVSKDIFCEFNSSSNCGQNTFEIEVLTLEKDGEIQQLEDGLNFKYTHDEQNSIELLDVKGNGFSIEQINLNTLYVGCYDEFTKKIEPEKLEKVQAILNQIIDRFNTVLNINLFSGS